MAGGSGEVETLYLGCNGITAGGACRIADQLRASPQVVTGVWLKRNPLGSGEGGRRPNSSRPHGRCAPSTSYRPGSTRPG